MGSKKAQKKRAQELAQRLERHPELMERMEAILGLAESEQLRTVDEIELRLIDEVRKLGGETIATWASRQEEAAGLELRKKQPQAQQREKKRSSSTRASD